MMRFEITIWCGDSPGPGSCFDWVSAGVFSAFDNHMRAKARRAAIDLGWSWSRRSGWRCPKHSAL